MQNSNEAGRVLRYATHPATLLALACVLLGVAWTVAHRPPVHRAGGLDDIESISTGYNLLAAGGLPWLLQWAAIALALVALTHQYRHFRGTDVLIGTLTPLLVGLCWWISLAVLYWRSDPIDVIHDMVSRHINRQFGDSAFWEIAVFDVLGPVVCPLRLAGPVSLAGWDFLWSGLSTGVVMVYCTWASRWSGLKLSLSVSCTRGEFLRLFLVQLVYFAPVVLHRWS
jgi:hypothetical protein